jgi:hypothetical protein
MSRSERDILRRGGLPILGALLLASAGCPAVETEPDDAAERPALPAHTPVRLADSLRLSADQPWSALSLPAHALAEAQLVYFTIGEVRNPDGQPLGVQAALRMADRTEAVGAVALFPVDQGGRFTLRLPPVARQLIARSVAESEGLELLVTMAPERAPALPDRRALLITDLEWASAPREDG